LIRTDQVTWRRPAGAIVTSTTTPGVAGADPGPASDVPGRSSACRWTCLTT